MLKMITVMYLLCAIYTSNPDITDPDFSQYITTEMPSNSLQVMTDMNQPELNEIPEKAEVDYLKELETLGFLKQENRDTALDIRNAVLRFQSFCNIPLNGKWDEKCMAALKKTLYENSFTFTDTIMKPPSEGKWLAINKAKRILTLYENSSVIKKYPVAVGNPITLTPSGKYKIVSRVVNPVWGGGGYAKPVEGGSSKNPLGYRWIGLSYKDGNNVGIHGNNSPYSIGKNISHGCIRMINSDVEELFGLIPISAAVWIGTDEELENWGVVQKEYGE
jgi:hypothetical protein